MPDSPLPGPTLRFPIDGPADRLSAIVGGMPGASLLEGGPGFGEAGRWSLLAARPSGTFLGFADPPGWRFSVRDSGGPSPALLPSRGDGDPLVALGRLIDRLGLTAPVDPGEDDAPPFLGGLIGYLGYDLAPLIERVPRRAPRREALPDVLFRLHDTFVAVDHRSGTATLWATSLLGEPAVVVEARAREWLAWLSGPAPKVRRSTVIEPPMATIEPDAYLRIVRRAIDYIHAGDIFQANIAQRFVAGGDLDALDLYSRLRRRSPAPYAALLTLDDGGAVISSSPELFYEVRGDRIVTRPIKGTRPRGGTPEEDEARRAELVASPKDRAELAMIVDLERNDLGRVCSYGTVRVAEPSVVESYATVHHQVATIEGALRPGVGPIDIVRAVFPGGSITGAPKVRAMEVIDELEPSCRGLYTGAIGYHGRGGRSAFNIAIRTIVLEGGRASYHVGGGIVADSDPQQEYEETLHKGRAMRDVLEGRA